MSPTTTQSTRRPGHLCRLARSVLMLLTTTLLSALPVGSASQAAAQTDGGYHAEIRRTAHGIPHVKSDDYGGLGFGYGHAFAEDNVCELAEEILTVTGRRSRFFGPDGSYNELAGPINNLVSDFYYTSVAQARTVERLLANRPDDTPRGPSRYARALVKGYAAGYNEYLRDTGVDRLPDPRCRGAAWVRPISALDVWRRIHRVTTLIGTGQLLSGIVAARPPSITTVPGPTALGAVAGRARELLAQINRAAPARDLHGDPLRLHRHLLAVQDIAGRLPGNELQGERREPPRGRDGVTPGDADVMAAGHGGDAVQRRAEHVDLAGDRERWHLARHRPCRTSTQSRPGR